MKSVFKQLFQRIFKGAKDMQQRGVALVITLLAMMVLVLLALALILQSNTEHTIAVNEQDSFRALGRAEEVLNWGDEIVRTWAGSTIPSPPTLTPALQGTIPTPYSTAPARSNFLGFRTLDTSITRANMNTTTETSKSGIYTDSDGKEWEMFRLPPFTGNVRTVILARVEDNYDDANTQNTTDTDLRIRLLVQAFYPVLVNSSGVEMSEADADVGYHATLARPQAIRNLVGRFWPGGTYAVRTQGDLEAWGTAELCGECGSMHANDLLKTGRTSSDNVQVCGEATSSGTFEYNGGSITGDRGLSPSVYIPVINPYDSAYVPKQSYFAQTYTLSDGSDYAAYNLTCPAPSASDPGSSKYFALVRNNNPSNPNLMAQVYKAYPDLSDPGKWYWRLIDERYKPGNPPGGSGIKEDFDAKLDNCGRVVSCGTTPTWSCQVDQVYDPGTSTWNPATAVVDEDDTNNNGFYGFTPAGNFGTPDTCSGDNISAASGTDYDNDQWTNNFLYVNNIDYASAPDTNTVEHAFAISSRNCGAATCPGVPALPGTGSEDSPNNTDFKTNTILAQSNDPGWSITGNRIYSPLYGAVLFIYGNVDMTGTLSNITYNNGVCTNTGTGCANGTTTTIPNTEAVPTNTWRVTAITYGSVIVGGSVRYSPAFPSTTGYNYLVTAGRDIKLRGNNNTFACNTTDCDGDPTGTAPGYSGIIVVHEQMDFAGNCGVNGFVIAEDRTACDNYVEATGANLSNGATGSIQIHYNCDDPPDPWASKGVAMKEWEEVQR